MKAPRIHIVPTQNRKRTRSSSPMKKLGPHFGSVYNGKTFNQACRSINQNPGQIYTTGFHKVLRRGKVSFIATVKVSISGKHKGNRVIIFQTVRSGIPYKSFVRVYGCCWGKMTNCYGTHIHQYTRLI